MKEFIVLLAVANGCFILGSFFGAGIYHAVNKLAGKVISDAKGVVAEAKQYVKTIEQDVKDGLPHV